MEVYLSGPITGHSYDAVCEWRQVVATALAEKGIRSLSPMRGVSRQAFAEELVTNAFMQPGGIMMRDFGDVRRADAIIVNLTDEKISIGTMFEIAWAWEMKKPVLAWVSNDVSWLKHPMLSAMITAQSQNLHEVIEIVFGFA